MPRINNKGLVTNSRQPKDVYYYFQANWVKHPVAHIAVRDWTERVSMENKMPVKVYTNQSVIELFHNGKSLGRKKVDNCMAVFDVSFAEGRNVLRAVTAACEDVAIVSYRRPEGEIAVNLGSSCYFQSDKSGLTWLPDQPYSEGGWGYIGGKAVQTQTEIHLTADGPLYQTVRNDMEVYRFDVPNGRYEVELLAADISKPQVASAYLLDRKEQTATISNGFSSSRPFTAMRRRYIVENTDGHLLIPLTHKGSLSAIKIRKL